MTKTSPNRLWSILTIALVIAIIIIAGIGLSRYKPAKAIEVTLSSDLGFIGLIEISGAVVNPGIYPFSGNDSVECLLQAAGGTSPNIGNVIVKLDVLKEDAAMRPQQINLNRAEEWLLEALPGIGSTKAKAIIVYRDQNGPFQHTSEIMNVEGIGQSLYDEIKYLITTTD